MASFFFVALLYVLNFRQVLGTEEYIVYPKDAEDEAACKKTADFLNELLFSGNVKDIVENDIISKSDGQPAKIEIPTGVYNTTSLNFDLNLLETKGEVLAQVGASEDLAVISWPPFQKLPKLKRGPLGEYYYNVSAGVDSYIYVIENGINEGHVDFQRMPYKPVEWLWTPQTTWNRRDNDPKEHGSCVASKAAGFINGVSKNSRLVIVKASHTMADTEWALAQIFDDIVKKGRQEKAVILYARSSTEEYSRESTLPVYWDSVRDLMHRLFGLGVHIVTSAGNDGQRSMVLDTVPAMWNEILPFIVVGAVTSRGGAARFSQGMWLDRGLVHAPGVNVRCAGGGNMQLFDGTSAAAGMVAGLVAYHLGKTPTKDPREMRNLLEQQSRSLVGGGDMPMVWNGENRLGRISK